MAHFQIRNTLGIPEHLRPRLRAFKDFKSDSTMQVLKEVHILKDAPRFSFKPAVSSGPSGRLRLECRPRNHVHQVRDWVPEGRHLQRLGVVPVRGFRRPVLAVHQPQLAPLILQPLETQLNGLQGCEIPVKKLTILQKVEHNNQNNSKLPVKPGAQKPIVRALSRIRKLDRARLSPVRNYPRKFKTSKHTPTKPGRVHPVQPPII